MKSIWTFVILAMALPAAYEPPANTPDRPAKLPTAENLFIITTDGFRWQEVFNGADSLLINSED
ncbi:MAG: hypothetical protein JNM19_12750, partial [Chitinophagaceae bacterium]|nr:hypothetical protein [Chitinophagaceae bacterium]